MKPAAIFPISGVMMLLAATANAGDKPAVNEMAAAVEAFDGGNYDEAIRLWHALAKRGDARAMVALGAVRYSGEGVDRDLALARNWYRRAAVAENAEGMQAYGHMLLRGEGGRMHSRAAYCWFQRASYKGKAWAREMVGRLKRDLPKVPQAGECVDLRARTADSVPSKSAK